MGNHQSPSHGFANNETNELPTGDKMGVTIEKKNIPHFKIVIIGDPGVGKSSIFLRYVKNQFNYEYKKTRKVVIENSIKTVNIPQKSVSSVTLWDVPGSEDMDLRASYFRNVDAAIVVVDMNDSESIELAGAWKQDFVNKASRAKFITCTLPNGSNITKLEELQCDPTTIPVLLVGNKYDLVEERIKAEMLKKSLRFENLEDKDEDAVEKNISNVEQRLGLKEENGSGDESEVKGRTRPFSSLRASKDHDNKPECVKLLEDVEEEHGFIGSVMVSAKDGDGSADHAIQSLIRHLLNKRLPPKKKNEKGAKHKVDQTHSEEYKPLRETGKEELDKLFQRCFMPLKRAGDYKTYYDLVLKRFKQSCADKGFLDFGHPSLEDCILGIRQALQAMGGLQLTVSDHEGFVSLDHTTNSHYQVPIEVEQVISVFNNEYGMVCRSVLRDCPIINGMLGKIDAKIEEKCNNIKELFPLEPEPVIIEIVNTCETNRARIAFVMSELAQLIDNVQKCRDKVNASLMW